MKNHLISLTTACMALLLTSAGAELPTEKPLKKISLPGDASWDYLTADSAARRLYVTHGTRVHVLDLDSQTVVGEIAPTPGVHGVALAPELSRGFTSNGLNATVTVFDLVTLKPIQALPVSGTKPDAILYEPFTRRVFTFNGDSDNTSAFDAATGDPLGTLALGGGPEFAVSDGAGNVFVNLEEKAEVVRFDPKTLQITARWPLAPGATATALALDREHHRLFSGCRNKHVIVLDANTGLLVADLPIGGTVDAIALDPEHQRAFVGCGEGVVTVVTWTDATHYRVADSIKTKRGAKTLAYDAKTGRLYLSVARFTAPAPTPENPEPKPAIVPGTFHLLVLEP